MQCRLEVATELQQRWRRTNSIVRFRARVNVHVQASLRIRVNVKCVIPLEQCKAG